MSDITYTRKHARTHTRTHTRARARGPVLNDDLKILKNLKDREKHFR